MKNNKVEELKNKIEKLEDTLFYINMIDHWTNEDRELYNNYSKQVQDLKAMLIKEIVEE